MLYYSAIFLLVCCLPWIYAGNSSSQMATARPPLLERTTCGDFFRAILDKRYDVLNSFLGNDARFVDYTLAHDGRVWASSKNAHSQTTFMVAAITNTQEMLEFFFHYIPNTLNYWLNFQDAFGRTALHYAIYYNALESVCFLLNYHPDMTKQDVDGQTPLFLAAQLYAHPADEDSALRRKILELLIDHCKNYAHAAFDIPDTAQRLLRDIVDDVQLKEYIKKAMQSAQTQQEFADEQSWVDVSCTTSET